MHLRVEQCLASVTGMQTQLVCCVNLWRGFAANGFAGIAGQLHPTRHRQAWPSCLHLRSRYVSKAAILTLPVRSVAVEKSKFHLNSKGLDR
jgi:hypothetical protein